MKSTAQASRWVHRARNPATASALIRAVIAMPSYDARLFGNTSAQGYPLRFLFASKPEAIGPVLGIVQRVIAGWLADQADLSRDTARHGAVTLIQRFGSALNLKVHFHMLWLDGVYEDITERPQRKPRLRRARAPTSTQLTELAGKLAHRVCQHLAGSASAG